MQQRIAFGTKRDVLYSCLMRGVGRKTTHERRLSPGLSPERRAVHQRRGSGIKIFEEGAEREASLRDWGAREAQRCDDGDPDVELCELPEVLNSVPPAEKSAVQEAVSRGRWLLGLLVLQSTSSFILDSYQELIKQHLVVTLFLTMLVGAGGNAGNQSSIKVIRGLATGTIKPTWPSICRTMANQAQVALMLASGLSVAGWLRVWLTNGDALNSSAIAVSLFFIVMSSVLVGTALPFALAKLGVDPANAGTSIQVVADIGGVITTCLCCHYILETFARSVGTA